MTRPNRQAQSQDHNQQEFFEPKKQNKKDTSIKMEENLENTFDINMTHISKNGVYPTNRLDGRSSGDNYLSTSMAHNHS